MVAEDRLPANMCPLRAEVAPPIRTARQGELDLELAAAAGPPDSGAPADGKDAPGEGGTEPADRFAVPGPALVPVEKAPHRFAQIVRQVGPGIERAHPVHQIGIAGRVQRDPVGSFRELPRCQEAGPGLGGVAAGRPPCGGGGGGDPGRRADVRRPRVNRDRPRRGDREQRRRARPRAPDPRYFGDAAAVLATALKCAYSLKSAGRCPLDVELGTWGRDASSRSAAPSVMGRFPSSGILQHTFVAIRPFVREASAFAASSHSRVGRRSSRCPWIGFRVGFCSVRSLTSMRRSADWRRSSAPARVRTSRRHGS